MHRETRAEVIAALREIYDGSWDRPIGAEGGKTLHWHGKVGMIAGCTPTIDRHHAVMGAMGERFLLYRLPEVDEDEQARQALAVAGHEPEMRSTLSAAVRGLFEADLDAPRELSPEESGRLISLATFVVRSRSAVEREGYSREIELVPGAEAPARLAKVLHRLLAGLDSLGVDRGLAWGVVAKAALDCIPALRREIVAVLHQGNPLTTDEIAEAIRYPTSTTRRGLEDLTAHRITDRSKAGNAAIWSLTTWAKERYEAVIPGMSGGLYLEKEGVRRLFGKGATREGGNGD